ADAACAGRCVLSVEAFDANLLRWGGRSAQRPSTSLRTSMCQTRATSGQDAGHITHRRHRLAAQEMDWLHYTLHHKRSPETATRGKEGKRRTPGPRGQWVTCPADFTGTEDGAALSGQDHSRPGGEELVEPPHGRLAEAGCQGRAHQVRVAMVVAQEVSQLVLQDRQQVDAVLLALVARQAELTVVSGRLIDEPTPAGGPEPV